MSTFSTSFEAIGTHWKIDIEHNPPLLLGADLFRTIHARIEAFDQAYSRFRPDSLVTKMSLVAGAYSLPPDGKLLLDTYQDLYKITNGAVTPLIGQTMAEAGYDPSYSLVPKTLHAPPTWDETLEYNFPHLHIRKPTMLDFGAAGKGYLVDIISKIIQDYGFTSFCIDAGGDIVYRYNGEKKLQVGLEHPNDASTVIGIANLNNNSICGSAGNRRTWGNFTHIINPYTRTSPTHILATWVIADTALIADALATCLFFVPSSTLKPHYNFHYVIMFENQTVEVSPDFPGEIFTA